MVIKKISAFLYQKDTKRQKDADYFIDTKQSTPSFSHSFILPPRLLIRLRKHPLHDLLSVLAPELHIMDARPFFINMFHAQICQILIKRPVRP